MKVDLRSPYPWFGGKSTVSSIIWKRFGVVSNYVEPFFGSGAVLLDRPDPQGIETVNDLNGWLCNFWRALQKDPEAVAHHADWPVSELDLHSRGDWLFYRQGADEFIENLRSNPDYFCVQSAGWWVWGQCCWIGRGWGKDARGKVSKQLPNLVNAGMGIHRKRPHLAGAGHGINRQHLQDEGLLTYFLGLSERMRRVRISCGDWSRVCTPAVTTRHGMTAVFLDPPYAVEDRDDCYVNDDRQVAHAVKEWAVENGKNKLFRIALCGYEGEHVMPEDWECVQWKANGGMANQSKKKQNANAGRERIWFSPHCLKDEQKLLF